MRVGLIAYLLHGGGGYRSAGVSTYCHQLLRALPAASPRTQYDAFVGKDAPQLSGVHPVVSILPTWRPPVRIFSEQLGVPLYAGIRPLQLVHGLVNVLPLGVRCAKVVTVHDLAFLRHPDRLHRSRVRYLTLAITQSVRRADAIIAVSKNTRADLVDITGIDVNKVTVVYPGVDPVFRPLPTAEVDEFRRATTGGRPYILFVGTLEPRKNLDVLLRAFAEVRRVDRIPHLLVLAGGRGWMDEPMFALVRQLGLENDVLLPGFVAPQNLPLWYNGADLFAYPSAYEGFGLPVVEAMACGVATITSSSSSLAEIAGTACLAVAAGSQEALAVALRQLIHDARLRTEMRRRAIERAADFSWPRAAAETVAVYGRVLSA